MGSEFFFTKITPMTWFRISHRFTVNKPTAITKKANALQILLTVLDTACMNIFFMFHDFWQSQLNLVLLQEIRITNEQMNQQLCNIGFTGRVNIDEEDLLKPGTAIAWRSTLPIRQVSTVVPCRARYALLGSYSIFNIYAPSGSDRHVERNNFFRKGHFSSFLTWSQSVDFGWWLLLCS